MGPVAEDPVVDQSEARSEPVAEPPIPRRLYKQREGAKLSGVCSGLAQYFSIDVVFVRAAFIGLTLLGFVGVLAYLILELLMPVREPQGAGSFKVLTLVIFAAALGIFLWTMKDYPGMGMLRIPELLMIPMVILMYGIPFVIVVAGVLLALVAANYLRSGPRW
jgi:phage shock protein PspC (stress-responsive transcriptional regulator)